jgi:hypothetical protein
MNVSEMSLGESLGARQEQRLPTRVWRVFDPMTDNVRVPGVVRGLAQYYAGGPERQEIWINRTQADDLPYKDYQRVPIDFIIDASRYHAGLRATPRNPCVCICPNLQDDGGGNVRLAEVLRDHGLSKNQRVVLEVEGCTIRLTARSTIS